MKSKKILLAIVLSIFSLSLLPNTAKADHCAGGELIYQWISDSTYRFILKFYRDCSGIDAYATQDLCIFEPCTGQSDSKVMQKWNGNLPDGRPNGSPVAAGCSGYPTKCEDPGSTIPGYREWWYSVIVTLPPGKCDAYKFAVWISARNFSQNINGGNLYLESTLNNTISDTNSSPYFSIKPVPYVCINQPTTYNNGAIDIDGDSLSTEVIEPLNGSSCSTPPPAIGFKAGTPAYVIPNNPIQTNNTFNVNAVSGNLTFTPSLAGGSTLTVRTNEYRGGRKIGSIMRDVQVQVLACSSTAPTVTPITSTITGGAYVSNRVNGCTNEKLDFCFNIQTADTEAILIAEDNHAFAMPTATITYTNQKSDSIRGCFSWTPTAIDSGFKSLILTVRDSTCKPPGILIYHTITLPMYIWPPTIAVPDTGICASQTAFLDVKGGNNFQWSVLPGGSPTSSLSCINCKSPIATPSLPTSYVVVSNASSFCARSRDTVEVDIKAGPVYTPLRDTITCPNNPIQLDLKINPPAGFNYNIKWTPNTFLNSDTLSNPTVNPNTDITYAVEISSSQNVCKAYDTVYVDVLDGFTINTPDTAICNGQSFQVSVTGDSRYTYTWESTNPAPGAFSSTTVIDPIITPAFVGNYMYTLKASYGTCQDSISSFFIDLQPVPVVTVDADASMCSGDTMKMTGTVTPSTYPFTLQWTPGASLDNPNILNPIFFAKETTTLTLTASTSAGCTDNDDVTLTVFPSDFMQATGDTALCPGASATIHMTGNGLSSFRWYPDFGISDNRSYDPVVSPTSTQTYMVTAIDTNSCNDTGYVKVTVHPKATVFLPDSITIYPGESYQMDPEGNAAYYSWFPPVGLSKTTISNPMAQPQVNTRYFVTATTEAGCTATDSINVIVDAESIISLPNAFSPGSNPNAEFKVLRRGDASLKSFTIFNRWGAKVFETSDINQGWNGQFKNEPQPMGVYIYVVEGTTASGRKFTKQGNVTLIR